MSKSELARELRFIKETSKELSVGEASELINQRRKFIKELKEVNKHLEAIKG